MQATRTIRPSAPASPYPAAIVDSLRKFIHGAGSALLVFSGAGAMTAGPGAGETTGLAALANYASLASPEGAVQAIVASGLSGPLQIAAAIFVFLAAGRCTERFLGFALTAIIMLAYFQGVTLEDSWSFMERFAARLTAAADAFQTAELG